ncbi:MAG: tetratricopeptide repeat protein [Bacteroidota bacterium]
MLRLVLSMLFIGVCCATLAQKRDSMYQLAQTTEEDSSKVALMNWVIASLLTDYPDSAVVLGKQNVEVAADLSDPLLLGESYLVLGNAMRRLGDYEDAIAANEQAIAAFGVAEDSLQLAKAYQGLGNVYRQTGDYTTALDLQIKTSEIQARNDAPNTDRARTYNQLATIYQAVEDYEKAVRYFQKSLAIWEDLQKPQMIAICYVNIGGQLIALERYEEAETYLQQAKALFQDLGLTYGISASVTNLSELYQKQQKFALAKENILEAMDFIQKRGDKGRLAMSYQTLGKIEQAQQHYSDAIAAYEKALTLADSIGKKASVRDAQKSLAEVHEQQGNYQLAHQFLTQYITTKDQIFDEEKSAQYQELQTKYESAQKDQEIAFLQEKQTIEKHIRTGLIIGCLVFLLLAILIYVSLYAARRSNRLLLEEQAVNRKLLAAQEKLLAQLENTQAQLIQNEKMASIGQLTAGVAHEINNPISFINTNILALKMDYLEIKSLLNQLNQLKIETSTKEDWAAILKMSKRLDTAYLSAEIDQLINAIERGVKRTRNIVKSLSIFSRKTTEKFELADINEGIRSTLMLAKTNIPKKIEIRTDLADLPAIECQIGPINQVFMNIINNAAQAIEEAGEIEIKSWQAADYIKVSIRDSGKGMDSNTKSQIFDPFFTTKDIGKGTGLGLSISYGIIEKHKGTIEVESEEGKGSLFLINLPVEQTPSTSKIS